VLVFDDILAGLIKGILRQNPGIPLYKNISNKINQSIFNTLHIWKGLFIGSFPIILSRFSWEIIQTLVGFISAHFVNIFNEVAAVKSLENVTILEGGGIGGSVSLGSFIILYKGNEAKVGNYLFMHEFGHCLQSRESGPLYLFKYGIPSLLTDNFAWMEKDANYRAKKYFKTYANVFNKAEKAQPTNTKVSPKLWEYVLFFLGIGLILIPYLNTEKSHLRKTISRA
jgi:hypothetical protein